jgi:GxxExxY protein
MNDSSSITENIIGAAYKVSNSLGVRFLEKVYENALFHELIKSGMEVKQQIPIQVLYDGTVVGEFYANLLFAKNVLVELKAVSSLTDVYLSQCLNYLRAANLPLCLLINFGENE